MSVQICFHCQNMDDEANLVFDIVNYALAHQACLDKKHIEWLENWRVEQMNYVVGFAFNEDKSRVLLIKKQKPEWQAGKWNGVGGKCEEGERRARDTMAREFAEETGIVTEPAYWTMFAELLCPMDKTRVVFFFCVLDDSTFAGYRQTTSEPVWACQTDLLSDVETLPNLRWLVPLARHWKEQNTEGSGHKLDHVILMESVVKL